MIKKLQCKGANSQRVSREMIIEIKQFNAGRMASHPFIEGIGPMVFPLRNTFTIENEVNGKKNHRNPSKISVPTEHFDQF